MQNLIFCCVILHTAVSGYKKSDSGSANIITSIPATFMINSYTINGMIAIASKYNSIINPVISIQFSAAVNRSAVGLPVLTFK
jgi:hypothetical protein